MRHPRIWLRLTAVTLMMIGAIAVSPRAARAVDYRLGILTATFVANIGDVLGVTVSVPRDQEIERLLLDRSSRAVVSVSPPIVSRDEVVRIVAGGDFSVQSETTLNGPLFREVRFNAETAYQINVPTTQATRAGSLRVTSDGLRALRLTITAPNGLSAQSTTFVNIIESRTFAKLPIVFVTAVEATPSIDADGNPVIGEPTRRKLVQLRDLLFRKPNDVPIGVQIQPDVIDALSRSTDAQDQRLFADLAERLPRNDVLIATYRPADVASYAAANERGAFESLLLRGEAVVDVWNGAALARRAVWVTSSALDARAVDFLRGFGVTNVVTIGNGVASYGRDTSPSRPYVLSSSTSGLVLGLADGRYGTLMDSPTGTAYESATALAAEVIAQRNEIAASTVGSAALSARQIIIAPPGGVPTEPLIAVIALRHLRNSPQVQLRRIYELPPTLEGLARIDAPTVALQDIAAIQARATQVRSSVDGVRDVVAANDGLVARWIELIDAATSTAIDDAERDAYLATVSREVSQVRNAVKLPESSFTFGGQESDIRLSLVNSSDYTISVTLRVASSSGKLSFTPALSELTLAPRAQREVLIATVARANGLIPVELVLSTPGGVVLDAAQVRIRVNAIAGLGRSVSVVFLLLLLLWWVIHLRRTYRKGRSSQHPALRSQA